MYISLFIVVMIAGFVMLLLPTSIIQKVCQYKWFCISQKLVGAILILVSVVSIYSIASGVLVLPLFK